MLQKSSKENNCHQLLFELLKNTLEQKEHRKRIATALLTEQQLRTEHKTIKIALGKQIGHTTAGLKLFSEYRNILFITNNEDLADHARRIAGLFSRKSTQDERDYIKSHIWSENAILKTVTAYWTTMHQNQDDVKIMPDIVILDCASHAQLSESTLWEMFPDMQYLVMLG